MSDTIGDISLKPDEAPEDLTNVNRDQREFLPNDMRNLADATVELCRVLFDSAGKEVFKAEDVFTPGEDGKLSDHFKKIRDQITKHQEESDAFKAHSEQVSRLISGTAGKTLRKALSGVSEVVLKITNGFANVADALGSRERIQAAKALQELIGAISNVIEAAEGDDRPDDTDAVLRDINRVITDAERVVAVAVLVEFLRAVFAALTNLFNAPSSAPSP